MMNPKPLASRLIFTAALMLPALPAYALPKAAENEDAPVTFVADLAKPKASPRQAPSGSKSKSTSTAGEKRKVPVQKKAPSQRKKSRHT